jgi:hypothetical protein
MKIYISLSELFILNYSLVQKVWINLVVQTFRMIILSEVMWCGQVDSVESAKCKMA